MKRKSFHDNSYFPMSNYNFFPKFCCIPLYKGHNLQPEL